MFIKTYLKIKMVINILTRDLKVKNVYLKQFNDFYTNKHL